MAILHGCINCKAIPSRSTAVIATSHGSDGQLRNEIISGNSQQHYLGLEFPDEGIYVVYQDRAIQIAAPLCDRRKCYTTQICCCDTPQFPVKGSPIASHSSNLGVVPWPVQKPCESCLINRLRLYQAAEAANRLNRQFLRHPRTLTLASLCDQQAFYYDSDIEETSIKSTNNGTFNPPMDSKTYCPPHILEWMKETWGEFVDAGCCEPCSITPVSDNDETGCDEVFSPKEQGSSETDSDWDDVDIPCTPTNTSSSMSNHVDSEEYDSIDDLIQEEFPKLLKKNAATSTKVDLPSSSINNDRAVEENDGDLAPVIIPPKTMTMARGFGAATEPENAPLLQLGQDSSMSGTADSKCIELQNIKGTTVFHDINQHKGGICGSNSNYGFLGFL